MATPPKQVQERPRKKTAGYWSNGVFIKAGSEPQDDSPPSRTEEKEASHALQKLGLELVDLRAGALGKLRDAGHVTDRLAEELLVYRKVSTHEGKRRQGQLLGKLMRQLPDEAVDAIKAALDEQASGSVSDTLALHRTESLRDRLIADDAALTEMLADPAFEAADPQQLRALIRQARKDLAAPVPDGAQRQGRAYRELFQLLKGLQA